MLTPKITDYKILKRDKKFDLESRVLSYMKEGWHPYYASEIATDTYQNLQEYLITALSKKKLTQIQNKYKHKSELYGIATSFSEVNFDTLLNLESILHTSRSIKVVTNNYNREVCEQFAHNQNIDILISN